MRNAPILDEMLGRLFLWGSIAWYIFWIANTQNDATMLGTCRPMCSKRVCTKNSSFQSHLLPQMAWNKTTLISRRPISQNYCDYSVCLCVEGEIIEIKERRGMVVLSGTSNPKVISGWTGQQISMSVISGSATFPVSGMNSPRVSSNKLPLFQRLQRWDCGWLWTLLSYRSIGSLKLSHPKEPEHHGCCIQESNLPLTPKGLPLSLIVFFFLKMQSSVFDDKGDPCGFMASFPYSQWSWEACAWYVSVLHHLGVHSTRGGKRTGHCRINKRVWGHLPCILKTWLNDSYILVRE